MRMIVLLVLIIMHRLININAFSNSRMKWTQSLRRWYTTSFKDIIKRSNQCKYHCRYLSTLHARKKAGSDDDKKITTKKKRIVIRASDVAAIIGTNNDKPP